MAAISAAKQGVSVFLLEPCRSLNSKRTPQILRCFKDQVLGGLRVDGFTKPFRIFR